MAADAEGPPAGLERAPEMICSVGALLFSDQPQVTALSSEALIRRARETVGTLTRAGDVSLRAALADLDFPVLAKRNTLIWELAHALLRDGPDAVYSPQDGDDAAAVVAENGARIFAVNLSGKMGAPSKDMPAYLALEAVPGLDALCGAFRSMRFESDAAFTGFVDTLVGGCPNLRLLTFSKHGPSNAGVAIDFAPLAQLTSLHTLLLDSHQLTADSFATLAQLPALRELSNTNNQNLQTDDVFRALCRLTQVTVLNVAPNMVNDERAVMLSDSLFGLRSLNLATAGIRDRGAAALSHMEHLHCLGLGANSIGDVGAVAIAGMPNLVFLDLQGAFGDEGVDALCALVEQRPHAVVRIRGPQSDVKISAARERGRTRIIEEHLRRRWAVLLARKHGGDGRLLVMPEHLLRKVLLFV